MPSADTQFGKGRSGNPAGRPKGSRNRVAAALDLVFDNAAEKVAAKAIEMALEGDQQALRMCLDRLVPPRKDRPVTFDLPPIEKTADLPKATSAILHAMAAGELTPAEAADVSKSVDVHVRAIEVHDLHERLARIEERGLQ